MITKTRADIKARRALTTALIDETATDWATATAVTSRILDRLHADGYRLVRSEP